MRNIRRKSAVRTDNTLIPSLRAYESMLKQVILSEVTAELRLVDLGWGSEDAVTAPLHQCEFIPSISVPHGHR